MMRKRNRLLSVFQSAGKRYFHAKSRIGRETIDNPGSWKILDRLYGNEPNETATGTFRPVHWTDRMFYYSKAARATRSRLAEYVRMMKSLGEEYARNNGGSVGILSLASGPGRDVVEVAECLGKEGIAVSALCADKCGEAMALGARLAWTKNMDVAFRQCKIADIRNYAEAGSFDIVITQGIMDYLSDERAVDLLRSARSLLREGGTILTSNMGRHVWIRFWMEAFGEWRLKYRSAEDLRKIMLDSGFAAENVGVYLLREGFHWMGVGKK
jgi:SAM-dependent methyltransferase